MTNVIIQAIGYTAQAIFGTRFFIQLWASERSGKVQSPAIFWQLSLAASALLLIYSILVMDLPIMLGQLLGYFIYVRNLMINKVWKKFHASFRVFIKVLPIAAIFIILSGDSYSIPDIIDNNSNIYLLIWGLAGQALFTSRFIYQWIYSERKQVSVFPLGFWLLSIGGALLISTYAAYMSLYPIIIGHALGILVYVRNLMIHFSLLSRKPRE